MKITRLSWTETAEGYTLAVTFPKMWPFEREEIEQVLTANGFSRAAEPSHWTTPADPTAPLAVWQGLETLGIALEMETATLPPILEAVVESLAFH